MQPAATSGHASLAPGELALIDALRRRDEQAFVKIVDLYHPSLLRLARFYLQNRTHAEEVVQETWLGVLQGIDRFEARSSLKTWIFHILMNRAKTRAVREGRWVTFSSLEVDADSAEPAVDPSRFLGADHPQWPGHWAAPPQSWGADPDKQLLAGEAREQLQKAIATLPPNQREVITLRDVEQWSSEEVCNVLGITETNQRVLLHRARSRVRTALETYFTKGK